MACAHSHVMLAACRQYPLTLCTGVWSPACRDCFVTRSGYRDYGKTRDVWTSFSRVRQRHIDRSKLETNLLEKRLDKLRALHFSTTSSLAAGTQAVPSSLSLSVMAAGITSVRSTLFSLTRMPALREAEQQIVAWQDETDVTHCPHCFKAFHMLTNRKHHCR